MNRTFERPARARVPGVTCAVANLEAALGKVIERLKKVSGILSPAKV